MGPHRAAEPGILEHSVTFPGLGSLPGDNQGAERDTLRSPPVLTLRTEGPGPGCSVSPGQGGGGWASMGPGREEGAPHTTRPTIWQQHRGIRTWVRSWVTSLRRWSWVSILSASTSARSAIRALALGPVWPSGGPCPPHPSAQAGDSGLEGLRISHWVFIPINVC